MNQSLLIHLYFEVIIKLVVKQLMEKKITRIRKPNNKLIGVSIACINGGPTTNKRKSFIKVSKLEAYSNIQVEYNCGL